MRHRNTAEENTEGIYTSWNSNLPSNVIKATTELSKKKFRQEHMSYSYYIIYILKSQA